MDKQKLRALPALPAPAWMTKEALGAKLRRNDIELWYADVKQEADIIIMRIYERSKLIGGIAHQENFRVYLDVKCREYISQKMDLETAKSWRTGRLDSVLSHSDRWGGWPSFEWEPGYVEKGYAPYLSFDKAGEDTLERALGPLEGAETWGLRIYRWQDKILKEKLLRRHDKELEPVVELMKQVPELPEGFYDWVKNEGTRRFDYAVYEPPKGRKKTEIQCTRCGAKMTARVNEIKPKVNHKGMCPACGEPVIWKTATSKFNRSVSFFRWEDLWKVSIIQRLRGRDGLVVRIFAVDVRFEMSYGWIIDKNYSISEIARKVFPDAHSADYDAYEFTRYKNQGEVRWAPADGTWHTDLSFLYTDNLREVLGGTAWQYSGLAELQHKTSPHRIPVVDYMITYPEAPFLEYFAKMGLIQMTNDMLHRYYRQDKLLDLDGKTPMEILHVNKQDLKTLVRLDGDFEMLRLLQKMQGFRMQLNDEELQDYVSMFGGDIGPLLACTNDRHLTPHRLMKYLKKQAVKAYNPKNRSHGASKASALLCLEKDLWKDWTDYIVWLARYMPESVEDEYYILPTDLPKAHDRLMKIELEKKEKAEAERRRKQEEAVNRFFEEMKDIGGIEMQARGLMIRLPKDAGEIRREGELQHHCVATYIDEVEKHETLILFVRKIEDPDTPFYTMEWKNGKVAQCRGMRNAAMTPEVKAFVGAFERKMQKKDREAVRQKVRVTA